MENISAAISAFAAYNMNSKTTGNRKGSAKKTTTTKAPGQKNTTKPRNTTGRKQTNGAARTTKQVPKTKVITNGKGAQNKNKPKQVAAKKKINENRETKASNGITENEIESLVQELLVSDQKLSKAQQKKKQELENYLEEQLQAQSSNGDEDDYTSGSSSGEFSDEYTLTSTDSLSDNSNEDNDSMSDSQSESTTETDSDSDSNLEKTPGARAPKQTSSRKENPTKIPNKQKRSATGSGNVSQKQKETNVSEPKKTKVAADKGSTRRQTIHSIPQAKKTEYSPPSGPVCQRRTDTASLKPEPISPPTNILKMNSVKEGERLFSWLINPITVRDFFANYWEQNAYLVKRNHPKYFSHLISFEGIDQMLLNKHVEFTKNIDITSYKNGVRKTHNPEGRALPPTVWDFYGQGCSIRILNPQTFLPCIFSFNTTLQEYFHCMVGANVYLTPPNSQGFAPHYDDIEAFVLQIEGRKRWKLYKPRNTAEVLPRTSSTNFSQSEIGQPILEEVLEPGDMLYFPRGTIHQAFTEPGYHSLHITLSVYQKQSFADLFELMMPQILNRAIAGDISLRRGVPLHMWQHAGVVHSNSDSRERGEFVMKMTELLKNCLTRVNLEEVVDAAVDQLAKKFQHEALPPEILQSERARTIYGSRSQTNERGECICDYQITVRTNVRLLRANILQLVEEEGKFHIYYYSDNSREYCEFEPNFIEIDRSEANSISFLVQSYPEYVGVSQIPLKNDTKRVEFITALWERGLLMMEKPFK